MVDDAVFMDGGKGIKALTRSCYLSGTSHVESSSISKAGIFSVDWSTG
jgi:hypothetical protein